MFAVVLEGFDPWLHSCVSCVSMCKCVRSMCGGFLALAFEEDCGPCTATEESSATRPHVRTIET